MPIITGPLNWPVLFCSLASVVVVCNAGGPAAWAVGWTYDDSVYCASIALRGKIDILSNKLE